MTNECVFYCTPSAILRGLPYNANIDAALDRIDRLRCQGKVRVVKASDNKLLASYLQASTPSVEKKYSIQQAFGNLHHPGFLFGRGVPALIVQSTSGTMAVDIFPHKKLERIVTVHEALSELFPNKETDLSHALFDAPAMH